MSDGKQYVIGIQNGVVELWDLESFRKIDNLGETLVYLSPDGTILTSFSYKDRDPGSVRLTRTADRYFINFLSIVYNLDVLAFSPRSEVIVSADRDESGVVLWGSVGGYWLRKLVGHPYLVVGLDFTPDGRVLGSCSWDGLVRLWGRPPEAAKK